MTAKYKCPSHFYLLRLQLLSTANQLTFYDTETLQQVINTSLPPTAVYITALPCKNTIVTFVTFTVTIHSFEEYVVY